MNLRFSITGKLLVWFLAVIAIFYGTILVLYINVQQVVRLSGSIVAKNYAIASGTKKMMGTLLSMEENKQKYLLLKKVDYLVFFNEAQRAFEENLAQVTRLTTMGHDISDVWLNISNDYSNYPNAAEVSTYLAGEIKDPEAVNTFWIPESIVNDWISKISGERLKNEQEIEQATRELNRKGRLSAKNGLIGLAVSSLVGLLGIFYLAYSMIRPLRELMDGIREISSDRLSKSLEIRGQDEFGELAHAFNEMSHRLHKEERMRSDFISMLSHEIRTPLTSIRESVNMIREKVMGPINSRQEKFLGIAGSEISRISDLLSHLMQASRLEPGLLNMQLEPIDPHTFASECANSIKLAAEAKNIELLIQVPPQLPPIVGDRKQLQQAMLNYLSNAVKFSEPDTRVTVGVRYQRSQSQLSFFVKDNGPGILDEDQAFLFNKYYRGQRERDRLEGVGLGLSIVKNIVESHHGTVWINSQVGKGSTFGFTLPSAPE
ncbi:MAG: HAMP domain-containing histidine kinase [Desulfosarcina sp.]|nr:HAMP domain-containing histidine kinase [Desulfosarcina sp.]MBC2743211.1 HAMP domain-containing histidine kinase [Desulfosarcina sp.]MBC2766122.1 HAMP domain-containing histidine kinase [Desulfosarcina sp.]